jgi:uncharacterized membrane protein YhaH (DUF805 family)
MINTYFKEWGTGKLQRLPYIGYHFLLIILTALVLIGAVIAVGATEQVLGGNLVQTQTMIANKFGWLLAVLLPILVLSVMSAQVNILGKRIRDIGLPVLSTIVAIIALSLVLNFLFPPEIISATTTSVQTATLSANSMAVTAKTNIIVQIFDAVIFLALLLLPSDFFKKEVI